jgi:hypothetical protein
VLLFATIFKIFKKLIELWCLLFNQITFVGNTVEKKKSALASGCACVFGWKRIT